MFRVDVTVYNTRKGLVVGSPWLMPDFFVEADDSERAQEKVALILGVPARRAQKFRVKIEEVPE